jgi:hypothetical protein
MKKFLAILILVTALMVTGTTVSADPGGGTNPNSTENTDV